MTDAKITITLPWPDKRLSSNSRAHWRSKADATKKARTSAHYIALAAKVQRDPCARLVFHFHPPDKRRRDMANMPQAMKAYIDGIADAMGCDDNGFRVQWPEEWSEPIKGGAVVVEIEDGRGLGNSVARYLRPAGNAEIP